ncbi:MAG: DUF1446 domain-containing protein [Propionibacteriaceae bacterium]|jgi:hypothetical protein|nr:DUF1446 domain-containing protein [Propionibacteriaceae bacterium]
MASQTSLPVKILVPTGMLGSGFPPETVAAGIRLGAQAIAVDGGSTDSGPHYLGQGVAKSAAASVRTDLEALIPPAHAAGIPIIVGSCGTSGTDSGVDWVASIVAEVCQAHGLAKRVARIYAEQDPGDIAVRVEAGLTRPLPPAAPLDVETVRKCDHIVGLMGHEPIAAALEAGAEIVLAGRASDTAVFAAFALLHGAPPGPTWHAAKVAECGGQCTTSPHLGGVLVTLDAGGFDIEPLAAESACTPESVSAHMLYENADPYRVIEPGGQLDTSQARHIALDQRRVRVEGSLFHPAATHTIKLEGAGRVGYETISFVGIRDPMILSQMGTWSEFLEGYLQQRLREVLGLAADQYQVALRYYGWNGVLGDLEPDLSAPKEVGVHFTARASDQATATAIAKIANPLLLHMPLPGMTHFPSFAFVTSPAEVERGPVYEFLLQHIALVVDPDELFRTELEDVK